MWVIFWGSRLEADLTSENNVAHTLELTDAKFWDVKLQMILDDRSPIFQGRSTEADKSLLEVKVVRNASHVRADIQATHAGKGENNRIHLHW